SSKASHSPTVSPQTTLQTAPLDQAASPKITHSSTMILAGPRNLLLSLFSKAPRSAAQDTFHPDFLLGFNDCAAAGCATAITKQIGAALLRTRNGSHQVS
ncbi:hypothetical protein N5A93_18965, partial [Roseovarius sp. EGI FJ00037]|uniref:hypothetical protein n=1 Tax=Roseovarius salincola TaxID=2978479 RepID=UPI0022A8BFC8